MKRTHAALCCVSPDVFAFPTTQWVRPAVLSKAPRPLQGVTDHVNGLSLMPLVP